MPCGMRQNRSKKPIKNKINSYFFAFLLKIVIFVTIELKKLL